MTTSFSVLYLRLKPLGGLSVFLIDWQVSFTLNEELTTIDTIGEKSSVVRAPREHPFTLQTVGGQTLAVFTENSSGENQDVTTSNAVNCCACKSYEVKIQNLS